MFAWIKNVFHRDETILPPGEGVWIGTGKPMHKSADTSVKPILVMPTRIDPRKRISAGHVILERGRVVVEGKGGDPEIYAALQAAIADANCSKEKP